MRRNVLGVALSFTLLPCSILAGDPPPGPGASQIDTKALEKKVAELERQLAQMHKELQAIRRELESKAEPAAMTPQEAVESFKQNPKQLFTVEFGVESAGWLDGPIPIGEDPMPPILADWDGRLPSGGKFSVLLTAKAIRGINDPTIGLPPAQPIYLGDSGRLKRLCKHLKGKGIRATGLLHPSRPSDRYTDYTLVVDDPAHFRFNQ